MATGILVPSDVHFECDVRCLVVVLSSFFWFCLYTYLAVAVLMFSVANRDAKTATAEDADSHIVMSEA